MTDRTSSLLLANAAAVWDGVTRPQHGVDVLLADGRVIAMEPRLQTGGARRVDATNWLITPGFVNAHHHLSQQLTRTRAVGGSLIDWLCHSYPAWALLDEEGAHVSAEVGLAELLLTGVTTISDFTYFYPRGRERIFDAQIEAAQTLGCRFYPVRGGLVELEAAVEARLGSSLVGHIEDTETLFREIDRVVDRYHDPEPDSRCRVGLGLTEKAYGDVSLMSELAQLAERLDLRIHTHLHPRPDERERCRERHGVDPLDFLREVGWWSDRLWVAHGTGLEDQELTRMASDDVALCTCPSSNARFATPIAPSLELHRRGGAVAIGVDGAASNDSGDFVGECRLSWQTQRHRQSGSSDAPVTIHEVLAWATAGGAKALGWPELGKLQVGGLADLAAFDLAALDYSGSTDPLAALLLCGTSHRAEMVIVAGQPVVEAGRLRNVDQHQLAERAHKAAQDLARRTGSRAPPSVAETGIFSR